MYLLYISLIWGALVIVLPKENIVRKYAWNSLIGLDNFINAAVFLGDPDETISSHAYKGALRGHRGWQLVNWVLEKIDPGHGARVVEMDEGTPDGRNPLFRKTP